MTAFDHRLALAGGGIEAPWRRVRSALSRGLKGLQYGQMISVLNRLPDTYLNEAGLRRPDIPDFARRAVYGEDCPLAARSARYTEAQDDRPEALSLGME